MAESNMRHKNRFEISSYLNRYYNNSNFYFELEKFICHSINIEEKADRRKSLNTGYRINLFKHTFNNFQPDRYVWISKSTFFSIKDNYELKKTINFNNVFTVEKTSRMNLALFDSGLITRRDIVAEILDKL